MWLLGSGVLSILVPALLSAMNVESRVFWYILAPGWKLSPFGRDDFPQMLLAISIDAIIYAAVTYGILLLILRMSTPIIRRP